MYCFNSHFSSFKLTFPTLFIQNMMQKRKKYERQKLISPEGAKPMAISGYLKRFSMVQWYYILSFRLQGRSVVFRLYMYKISKKSSYTKVLYKMGQEFLDIQYVDNYVRLNGRITDPKCPCWDPTLFT